MRIDSIQVNNATGITLIEVMISVMLLSVGLLGALKLHIHALVMIRQSAHLSTALDLANELATGMRSNPQPVRGDGSIAFLPIDYRASRDPPPTPGDCLTHVCRAEQLRAADVAHWLQSIRQQLPNVRAVVCQDDNSWDRGRQQLRWECNLGQAGFGAVTVIKLGWSDNHEAAELSAPRIAVQVLPETN